MNRYFTYSYSFLLLLATVSCTYHSEEELYPTPPCDTTNVTYSGVVVQIIEQNCFDCHSNENVAVSNVSLEGYDNLKIKVDDETLLKTIKHEPGVSPMPDDRPKLNDCDILKIELWVNEGAPNN